jgi:YebC/PmpR family DNA-binding regulatory protein
MPKENIDRAIKKGTSGETDNMEEIRYEGFGPGGVGLIVETLTDNRNRAAANVRTVFGKNGGNMGETGSVSFMFDRVGQILYPADAGSEEAILEAAIEAGAEDVSSDEESHLIFTSMEGMFDVAAALETTIGSPKSVGIVWRPKTSTPIDGEAGATLMKLIDALDDDDDVQTVYSNFEMSDEEMAKLG